ncbi:MAG: 16S rRNA (guanine(966)-N(2))-methyltransferase RsmD [Lachnospiraceae bacterium]|nr:16S rRNA (guanine(966)-N(2))-methyltransferase RsmD [Lachnospiraceae bacterium]
MRVIAGSARRLLLKSVDGMDTRPTTDRIKETIFNIINDELYEAVFVDLFAGSGGIGIEALSRGAKEAIFVENNRRAISVIKENLEHTHFEDKAKVYFGDALSVIPRLREYPHIDVIYIDPPYKGDFYEPVLKALSGLSGVDKDTLIVAEADKHISFDFIDDMDYTIERVKDYKTNKHVFIRSTHD